MSAETNGWIDGKRIGRMLQADTPVPWMQLRRVKAQIAKAEQDLATALPKFFVAMPAYGQGVADGSWQGVYLTPTEHLDTLVARAKRKSSLLCNNFNHLWATAIQETTRGNVTHFAMLHSDVNPDRFWVDTLYEELCQHKADIVSAVIPIKDERGLTSTAILGENSWERRRLTMAEVFKLPETFGVEDTHKAGMNPDRRSLLVNTGCWLTDLRHPMYQEKDEEGWFKIFFTINDGIRQVKDTLEIHLEPEDWYFSRRVAETNPDAKVLATRRVRVEHRGTYDYPNDQPFGQWKVDSDVVDDSPPAAEPDATEEVAAVK